MVMEGVVHNPLFYLILLSGTWTTGSRLYNQYRVGVADPTKPWGYYDIPFSDKAQITAYYFALIGSLIYAMQYNNRFKKSPQQLKYGYY